MQEKSARVSPDPSPRCACCLASSNPLPTSPSLQQRARHIFLCPPHGAVERLLFSAILLLLFVGAVWGLLGNRPGNEETWKTIYSLVFLLVVSHGLGWMAGKVKLPPLLGMLIAGFCVKNIPGVNEIFQFSQPWSSSLRKMALVVILVRAGMGLDPAALKRLSFAVVRLAFIPCLVETCVVVLVTYFLLDLPVAWGFVLGFVLAAVSPAVVVPSMIWCQEQRLGVDKGIPTLVIAAASIDDVLAITGFSVALGIAFDSGDSLAFVILRGPIEVAVGVGYGILVGLVAWYLPSWNHASLSANPLIVSRFFLLFLLGVFAAFVFEEAEFPGAGALGALTSAFVANLGWRRQGWKDDDANPVNIVFGLIWRLLAQPLLFGLIGAEIRALDLEGKTVGLGIGCLAISLACRMVASMVAVLRSGLNLREKIFVPFAWLPKATVQAAIGATAYDQAVARKNEAGVPTAASVATNTTDIFNATSSDLNATTASVVDELQANIDRGRQVLTIAVLAILITAPLGAVLISLTAPRLLVRGPTPTKGKHNEGLDVVEESPL